MIANQTYIESSNVLCNVRNGCDSPWARRIAHRPGALSRNKGLSNTVTQVHASRQSKIAARVLYSAATRIRHQTPDHASSMSTAGEALVCSPWHATGTRHTIAPALFRPVKVSS